MNIALDYDGTYTRDPKLWNAFIALAQAAWHDVRCVTLRFQNEPVNMPCEVIYCCRGGKLRTAHMNGFPVDVWIDDMPSHILL